MQTICFITLWFALFWPPVPAEENYLTLLDKIINNYKNMFYAVSDVVPEIQAKFIYTPVNYKDPMWDFNSGLRTIVLLHTSQSFAPMLKALQRMLKVRELLKSYSLSDSQQIYNASGLEKELNDDNVQDSDVWRPVGLTFDDDSVLVILNPQDVGLVNSQISVPLLRTFFQSATEQFKQ